VPPLLSVLLPTRDRLTYLRQAAETVLRQDDRDLELVISDNDSSEDIGAFCEGLGDERVRYVRTERFVPVTENWNFALEHSSGRYVVMLGDDDGLMPGFVSNLRALAQRFDNPDLIYTGAWVHTYPGVDPRIPDGELKPYGYAEFLRGRHEPFVLDPADARRMVRHALAFRVRYGFNMQFATVSRTLIDALTEHGPFYQSAFPDYYAMNACFLRARRIVADPAERVAIGVTPKSYGFFHVNRREDAGKAFLGGQAESLPGTNINSGWLSALEALESRYGPELPARPARGRYRLLQSVHVYEGHYLSDEDRTGDLAALEGRLRWWERTAGRVVFGTARRLRPVVPARLRNAISYVFHRYGLRQFPDWHAKPLAGSYPTLLDVFERQASTSSTGTARATTTIDQ
jgi:hypothetical protein